MELSPILRIFKEDEKAYIYTASILIDDKTAHKIISAWTTMHVTWVPVKGEPPEEKCLLWDWLWEGVHIDWPSFSKRSGVDLPRLQKSFEPLKANRLIYPDGTAADHALGVLKAEVASGLNKANSAKKKQG